MRLQPGEFTGLPGLLAGIEGGGALRSKGKAKEREVRAKRKGGKKPRKMNCVIRL